MGTCREGQGGGGQIQEIDGDGQKRVARSWRWWLRPNSRSTLHRPMSDCRWQMADSSWPMADGGGGEEGRAGRGVLRNQCGVSGLCARDASTHPGHCPGAGAGRGPADGFPGATRSGDLRRPRPWRAERGGRHRTDTNISRHQHFWPASTPARHQHDTNTTPAPTPASTPASTPAPPVGNA